MILLIEKNHIYTVDYLPEEYYIDLGFYTKKRKDSFYYFKLLMDDSSFFIFDIPKASLMNPTRMLFSGKGFLSGKYRENEFEIWRKNELEKLNKKLQLKFDYVLEQERDSVEKSYYQNSNSEMRFVKLNVDDGGDIYSDIYDSTTEFCDSNNFESVHDIKFITIPIEFSKVIQYLKITKINSYKIINKAILEIPGNAFCEILQSTKANLYDILTQRQ